MCGAIHSLPNTPSWSGAQLKKKAQGQLYLHLSLVTSNELSDQDLIPFASITNPTQWVPRILSLVFSRPLVSLSTKTHGALPLLTLLVLCDLVLGYGATLFILYCTGRKDIPVLN